MQFALTRGDVHCLQVDAKFKAQESAFAADDDVPAAAAADHRDHQDTGAVAVDEAAAAADGNVAAADHSEL
ncbi:hypothetical protein COO60DRAFT_1644219 [Scenedesmus sp. NREL 46B-D3]|nr:hypothetical protein COO60DRAFT_1644219 [Scenedesmus sp. NREL 46B-D3]